MATEEKQYGIGEVKEILANEFSDITISKIRFLEKEGLISPDRTPSGYRKFTKGHIKQLSYILRLQREEYLPLSVIKKKIQDLKSGKVRAGDMNVMSGIAEEASIEGEAPVSMDLAPSKLGLSLETIQELVDFGVVNLSDGPEGKYFPAGEMKILSVVKELFRYGIEPRHLRMYVQFVGRESAFIEQIIRPQLQHKDPNARRSALKDLENLMNLSRMLTDALLRRSLSDYLPRPAKLEIPGEEENPDEVFEKHPGATAESPEEVEPQPETGGRETGQQMFPE